MTATPPAATFTRHLDVPGRALGIGAHPDDIEFQCGGTLAGWAAAGCRVDLLVCTDGSKGSWDVDADLGDLIEDRKREARAAAGVLGVTGEVCFLDWVDGEVDANPDRVRRVAEEIRRLTPDVVLTHDPWRRYRWHPDHRNVGWIVLDAVVAARDPHFFPGVPHHRPSALLLFEPDEPDLAVDVTTTLDTKIAALLEHRSQYRSTMGITDSGDADQVARFRAEVERRARERGPDGTLVEVFKVMDP